MSRTTWSAGAIALLLTTIAAGCERVATVGSPGDAPLGGPVDTAAPTPKGVEFSVERGFYHDPVSVALNTKSPDATIKFTRDGSWPSAEQGQIYSGPIVVSAPTVLRAAAVDPTGTQSATATHTYIFLDDVLRQPDLPDGFPETWGERTADYAMDGAVVKNRHYVERLRRGLVDLPSISLVLDPGDLYDPNRGIYVNAIQRGAEWERPASVELIDPAGAASWGTGAGVRMQGGWVRQDDKTLKHAFRLVFRKEYGPPRLEAKLFPGLGVDTFDTLLLRAGLQDSWLINTEGQRERALYVKDEWLRRTEQAMGRPSAHGTFVHLYLNGLYWGLYDLVERPDADFAVDHFGADPQSYDVLKAGVLTDGESEAWHTMLSVARAGVQDEEHFRELERHVDIASLIDHMILNFYAGNVDWPKRNYYAIKQRPEGLFHFLSWDGERVLEHLDRNVVDVHGGDNPSLLYHHLRENAEFRLRFADQVNRHLGPGGALHVAGVETADGAVHLGSNMPAARLAGLTSRIKNAVVAESARWGDFRRPDQPYTRDEEWQDEIDRLASEFFPARGDVLLTQLRAINMYPPFDAPIFEPAGSPGSIADMKIVNPVGSGQLLYTIDGTDPRVSFSGLVATGARQSVGPVTLPPFAHVKARVKAGKSWSALTEGVFGVPALRISEIMYNPPPGKHEFIEIANSSPIPVPLYDVAQPGYRWRLAGGVDYEFPTRFTLPPGGMALIVGTDAEHFRSTYRVPQEVAVVGPFAGRLRNGGERLRIERPGTVAPDGSRSYLPVESVTFDSRMPWPPAADGVGASLERVDLDRPANDPANWTGDEIGGSPGRR